MTRSECRCPCHTPGVRMMHCFPCCEPDVLTELGIPGAVVRSYDFQFAPEHQKEIKDRLQIKFDEVFRGRSPDSHLGHEGAE